MTRELLPYLRLPYPLLYEAADATHEAVTRRSFKLKDARSLCEVLQTRDSLAPCKPPAVRQLPVSLQPSEV